LPFTGTYHHTIDSKGRLIVPSRLRDQLQDEEIVLTVWPEGCISVWWGEGWEKLQTQLLEQRKSDAKTRATVRRLSGQAHTDRVDKQGRITVPEHLREWAGITRDCVVTGVFDHGEIWNPERLERQDGEVAEAGAFEELFDRLDL
jgi:MraZ protein